MLADLQVQPRRGTPGRVGVGAEVGVGLGAHPVELAAQPGVDLDQFVGEGGGFAGRRLDRGAFQRHHRDGAVGLGLVVAVAGEPADDLGERPVACGALQEDRDRLEGLGADLDGHQGVGEQVVVPGGVAGRAGRGGDDQQPFAVAEEAQRAGLLAAGAGARRGEQQQVAALEGAADASAVGAELLDDRAVEVADVRLGAVERVRGL